MCTLHGDNVLSPQVHTAAEALQADTSADASGKQAEEASSEVLGVSTATWRKEMREWVMHWQAVLQLQHLSWQERCRIATQTGMEEVLEFTRVKILNDPEPPGAFRSLHDHLREVREARTSGAEEEVVRDDSRGDDHSAKGHQSRGGGHRENPGREQGLQSSEAAGAAEQDAAAAPGCISEAFQVLSAECSASEFSGQVFLQLMRIVAQEMGLRVSTLDMMLLEFEHSVTVA